MPCIEYLFIIIIYFNIKTYNGTMALSAASLCSVDQEEKDDSQLSMNEGRGGEGCSAISLSS